VAPFSNFTESANNGKQKNHKALLAAFNTSNYFLFNRKFVTVLKLSREEALFLQDVINHYGMDGTVKQDDGFFLCTVKYLLRSLDWSEATQTRMLTKLVDRKFIKVRWDEKTGHRWVFIDICVIADLVVESTSPQLEGSEQKDPTLKLREGLPSKRGLNKEGIKEVHTVRAASRPDGEDEMSFLGKTNTKPVEVQPPPQDLSSTEPNRLASRFYEIISRHRKLMRRPKGAAWPLAFKELLTHRSTEQIVKVLDWYDKNIHDQFTPQKYSAETFCRDFVAVESAMQRQLQKAKKQKQELRTW
jgi:hypothetical protein